MASKMTKTLASNGRMGSRVYPNEPTPMHFTQLFLPKATALPPPATYERKHRHRRGCGSSLGCCCCSVAVTLCSLLLAFVFLLGVAALITWLVLRPVHAPRYSIEDLQMKTFSVTAENALDVDAVYRIRAENPNGKLGFEYGVIDMETSYDGHVFGRSAIAAFSQGHRNVTSLTSQVVVKNFAFVPASVGSALATDVRRGSVALHARGSTRVRVKIGAITSFAVRISVDCDLTVKPPTATSPGSVISKTCKLGR